MIAFTAALLLLPVPEACASPNMAAEWKSEYEDIDERAGMDCCSSLYRKLTIEQEGDRITIAESVLMARQYLDRESNYKTDGSESVNKS